MDKLMFRRYARLVVGTLDVTGLDFTFSIEKNLKKEPNRIELVVYNLSAEHRKELQALKRVPFALHVGYLGLENTQSLPGSISLDSNKDAGSQSETLLFKGDLGQVFTQRDGPDWITIIRAGDGEKAHVTSRINKSYAKNIPYAAIAQDLIKQMGIDDKAALSRLARRDFTGANSTSLNNYVVSGAVSRELQRVMDRFELGYSIQDGELVILGKTDTRNTNPILISPDSGLIGSPEPGRKGVIRFRSLILPELSAGKKIRLESENYSGFFRIERIVYNGSTFDNQWYADIDGSSI